MLRRALTSIAVAALLLPLTSAPAQASAQPIKNVILFGDSVPYGTACRCEPFGDLYATTISESNRWHVNTKNFSNPGAKVQDVRALLNTPTAQAAVRQATTVLIMVGANDFEDAFTKDQQQACPNTGCYSTIAQKLKLHTINIVQIIRKIHLTPLSVVILDYWDVVEDGATAVRDYGAQGLLKSHTATSYANTALLAAAHATHSSYVSTSTAFRGLDNNQDPTSLLAADGDHPNAAGHLAIARALTKTRPHG